MILAVDLGSTSFKAAVFDRRLRCMASGTGAVRHRFGPGGLVELPEAAALAALREALASARVRNHRIAIVAVTSQAQTCTMVDEGGHARMPFVSWQDTRPAGLIAALGRELPDFARHCSFADMLPGLQLCHLRRMRPAGDGMPLLLPSYVVRLLTGDSVTDNNIAAMSGLYSLALGAWWPAALRSCGLRASRMPRVAPVGDIATVTGGGARRFGLRAGVPVVLAGNDQTAGGYAAALERDASLLITLGTAQVAYACRRRMPGPKLGTVRGPYPGGLFYSMAADNCGGSSVNWAKTVIGGCATDEAFFAAAGESPAGSHGLVFDASLDVGKGSWANLGLHHQSSDLARSVLECLGARMAAMVRTLGIEVRGRTVRVAGGGSRQALWRRIVADSVGARLALTEAAPLLGAARMAARHLMSGAARMET